MQNWSAFEITWSGKNFPNSNQNSRIPFDIVIISFLVCTLTYLLVGAAVFDALESEQELRLVGFFKKI
jgi:purine-cytosine permease-like protein